MGTYYKVIAQIYINHEYFGGTSYTSATLQPLPETALFLKNHRIILKKKNDGFSLLQEASDETHEATITFDTVKLLFAIKLNDPHFQIRSGLTYDLRQKKIVIEVGKENNVKVGPANVMSVVHSGSELDLSETVIVRDQSNNTLYNSETDSVHQFNAIEQDVYALNGERIFKYHSDLNCEVVVVMLLETTQEKRDFNITLPAGSYRWRYQILKKYHPAKTLKLVDENENIYFEELPSGESEKFTFISQNAVKLSQLVSSIITIYEGENIVKKYLPLPEISNARFLSGDDKTLVLEAYVTV